jgi:hypothetical protein
MAHNADHSVVSAAVRRGLIRGLQFTSLQQETVHVCYAESFHCVCAMCGVVHLGGENYLQVSLYVA